MKLFTIAPDVKLGENVKVYNYVNLYGCEIGDETRIGCFVEIQKNAKIGKRCKISSHTFICEGVTIEDNVFIGHNVTFINDKISQGDEWERNTQGRRRVGSGTHSGKKRGVCRIQRHPPQQGNDRGKRHRRGRQCGDP